MVLSSRLYIMLKWPSCKAVVTWNILATKCTCCQDRFFALGFLCLYSGPSFLLIGADWIILPWPSCQSIINELVHNIGDIYQYKAADPWATEHETTSSQRMATITVNKMSEKKFYRGHHNSVTGKNHFNTE